MVLVGFSDSIPTHIQAFLFCTTNQKPKPLDALHPNESYGLAPTPRYGFAPNESYGLAPTPSLGRVYTLPQFFGR